MGVRCSGKTTSEGSPLPPVEIAEDLIVSLVFFHDINVVDFGVEIGHQVLVAVMTVPVVQRREVIVAGEPAT